MTILHDFGGGSRLWAKEGGRFYFTCPAGFSSFSQLFFFSPKIMGGRGAPGPSPRSTTGLLLCANVYSSCVYKGDRFKDNLSLTCEPSISQQKHFSTRISPPPPGVSKGFIEGEALRLLWTNSSETTFHENTRQFKSRPHERGYPDTLVNKVLSEVKFEERKSALDSKKRKIIPHSST